MMNVLIYINARPRDDKRGVDQDVESQLKTLRHFAARQGWSIVGEFIDRPSTSLDDRRAFMKLLARAMIGGVQGVLVTSREQLGLSPRQFVKFADELYERDVCVISLREGSDLGAPLRGCIRRGIDLLAPAWNIGMGRGSWR